MSKTYEQVLQEIEQLQKEAEQLRQVEVSAVIEEVKSKIAKYKLTAKDLGLEPVRFLEPPKAEKTKMPPKYRNPENEKETYTGKGPKPEWLKKKEAEGRNKEEFLIKN